MDSKARGVSKAWPVCPRGTDKSEEVVDKLEKRKERETFRRGFVLMEGDFLKVKVPWCYSDSGVWMTRDCSGRCLLSWLRDRVSETRVPPLGASLVLSVPWPQTLLTLEPDSAPAWAPARQLG